MSMIQQSRGSVYCASNDHVVCQYHRLRHQFLLPMHPKVLAQPHVASPLMSVAPLHPLHRRPPSHASCWQCPAFWCFVVHCRYQSPCQRHPNFGVYSHLCPPCEYPPPFVFFHPLHLRRPWLHAPPSDVAGVPTVVGRNATAGCEPSGILQSETQLVEPSPAAR